MSVNRNNTHLQLRLLIFFVVVFRFELANQRAQIVDAVTHQLKVVEVGLLKLHIHLR